MYPSNSKPSSSDELIQLCRTLIDLYEENRFLREELLRLSSPAETTASNQSTALTQTTAPTQSTDSAHTTAQTQTTASTQSTALSASWQIASSSAVLTTVAPSTGSTRGASATTPPERNERLSTQSYCSTPPGFEAFTGPTNSVTETSAQRDRKNGTCDKYVIPAKRTTALHRCEISTPITAGLATPIVSLIPVTIPVSSSTNSTDVPQRADVASTDPKINGIFFGFGQVQVYFTNNTFVTTFTVEQLNTYLDNHRCDLLLTVCSHDPATAAKFGDYNSGWFKFILSCSSIKLTGVYFKKSLMSTFKTIDMWKHLQVLERNVIFVEDPST